MKKLLLLLLLIISTNCIAQVTTPPSGRTTHYGLRMYAQHATPSADSLNQNLKDIDSAIYQRAADILALRGLVTRNPDSVKYVSVKFANDSVTNTFSTVQAAINNSGSGTLVYVYPGTYNENDTLKNGVNIYLSAGAVLESNNSTRPTIFANGVTCIISGEGWIGQSNTTGVNAIRLTNSSNVTINCNIRNYGAVNTTSSPYTGAVLSIKQSTVNVFCDEIYSQKGVCIFFDTAATGDVEAAKQIKSNTSVTIGIRSNSRININNSYIKSDSVLFSASVISIVSDTPKVYLNNCKVEIIGNESTGGAFIEDRSAFYLKANKPTTKLNLKDCEIITWATAANPPISTDIQLTSVTYTLGTGLVSTVAGNDTIKGVGTVFLSEITPSSDITIYYTDGTNLSIFIPYVISDTKISKTYTPFGYPPMPKTGTGYFYYEDAGGEDTEVDTAQYSTVVLRGTNWFSQGSSTHVTFSGSYNYGTGFMKTKAEETISNVYSNNAILDVTDGIIDINKSNFFRIHLNQNTTVAFANVTSERVYPITIYVYKTDTLTYGLTWTEVTFPDDITPPIPSNEMLDVYTFYVNYSAILNKKIILGNVVRNFANPY